LCVFKKQGINFKLSLQISGAKCAASFMERCIIYIGENANECVKTNAFLTLTKDAIIKIISSDYVRVYNGLYIIY